MFFFRKVGTAHPTKSIVFGVYQAVGERANFAQIERLYLTLGILAIILTVLKNYQ